NRQARHHLPPRRRRLRHDQRRGIREITGSRLPHGGTRRTAPCCPCPAGRPNPIASSGCCQRIPSGTTRSLEAVSAHELPPPASRPSRITTRRGRPGGTFQRSVLPQRPRLALPTLRSPHPTR